MVLGQVLLSVPGRLGDSASWEAFVCNLLHVTQYRYAGNISSIISKFSRTLMKVSRQYHSIAGIYTTLAFYEQDGACSVSFLVLHMLRLDGDTGPLNEYILNRATIIGGWKKCCRAGNPQRGCTPTRLVL